MGLKRRREWECVVCRTVSTSTFWQSTKNRKYAGVAYHLGAELMNVCVETCGGLATDAVRLVRAIAEEGARWSIGGRSSSSIERAVVRRHRCSCATWQCTRHVDRLLSFNDYPCYGDKTG